MGAGQVLSAFAMKGLLPSPETRVFVARACPNASDATLIIPDEKRDIGSLIRYGRDGPASSTVDKREIARLIGDSLGRSADLMFEAVLSRGATIAELEARGDRIDRILADTAANLSRLTRDSPAP